MFGRPGWKMEPAWHRVQTLKSDMNVGEDGVWMPSDHEEYLSMFLAFANVLVPKGQACGIMLTRISGEEDSVSLSVLADAVVGGTDIKVLSLRDMELGRDYEVESPRGGKLRKRFSSKRLAINMSDGAQPLRWESTKTTRGEAFHLARVISEDHIETLDLSNSGICTKEARVAPCEDIFRLVLLKERGGLREGMDT